MKTYKLKSNVFFKKTTEKSVLLDIELDQLFHFSGDAGLMVALIAKASDQKETVTVESLQTNLINSSAIFSNNETQKACIEEALTFMVKNNLIEVI